MMLVGFISGRNMRIVYPCIFFCAEIFNLKYLYLTPILEGISISLSWSNIFPLIWQSDLKLKKFLHIIEDSPVYPVIYDSNRWDDVCSSLFTVTLIRQLPLCHCYLIPVISGFLVFKMLSSYHVDDFTDNVYFSTQFPLKKLGFTLCK